ncbi:MAG: cytochrome c1 [Hyphomonadaceae bacterium]|nr:cytochrome c1 [Hyphomonadaceae bacterium]
MRAHCLAALAAALALFATPQAHAETQQAHPHAEKWSFSGPFGTYDRASVQRGFLVYETVCAACHSLRHLSYRNLGEEGGPFAAYRVFNEETGQHETTLGLHGGHEGKLVEIQDNPYVAAIAAAVMIPDIDRDTGEATERAGRPSDRFRSPYPNPIAARAANGGALPPDLSVITLARHDGANYVHSLLTGYSDPPAGVDVVQGKYYNRYFAGGWIAMPPPLASADMVTYSDGTAATPEQMARDVTHFLAWASDPKMEMRKSLGLQSMAFLLVLTFLVYLAYKQVWRGTKH